MKRTIAALLLAAFLLMTFTGCTTLDKFLEAYGGEQEEETIKIGVFEPLSGPDEEAASLELSGILLAHEQYPSVLGKKVELVYGDNRSDADFAAIAAQGLIDEGVSLVLGSYGNSLSMAGGELFLGAGIPVIGITCTNPLVTADNPCFFRVSAVDAFQGIMAAKYVYNNIKGKPAAVMKAKGDDYGTALSQSFSGKLVSLTGDEKSIACTVEYEKAEDAKQQLEEIKASGAGVVFLPSQAGEAALIIKQARELGISAQFLGTDLWHDERLIKEGGASAEGAVFAALNGIGTSLSERTEEFLALYRSAYGEPDDSIGSVALGYDAYLLALDAFERQRLAASKEDSAGGKSLQEILKETRGFQGASGSLTFDENGNPIKPVVFMAVENGAFVFRYTAEPEWGQ